MGKAREVQLQIMVKFVFPNNLNELYNLSSWLRRKLRKKRGKL